MKMEKANPENAASPPARPTPKSAKPRREKKWSDVRLPVLRFTPRAWAKLQYFCHRGDTEIGGFGITPTGDLLLIEDLVTVKQTASAVSVAFDNAAVADHFEAQVDAGRRPDQFARIWLHTHPGTCPLPSSTDEETFTRVFGRCEWAVMFILARGGQTYARLRFNIGPGGHLLIPVQVEFLAPFEGSDHAAWELEYAANIHAMEWSCERKRPEAKGKVTEESREAVLDPPGEIEPAVPFGYGEFDDFDLYEEVI